MSSACTTTRRSGRWCCAWMEDPGSRRSITHQPVLQIIPRQAGAAQPQLCPHGTTDLFAAFNITNGTLISKIAAAAGPRGSRKFLTRIDKAVPAGLEVHLVCDNLATHKAPVIQAWLARHPRFCLHFAPTGSSSMDQVKTIDRLLDRSDDPPRMHKSVQALEADIHFPWMKNSSANPRPFAWTRTSQRGGSSHWQSI